MMKRLSSLVQGLEPQSQMPAQIVRHKTRFDRMWLISNLPKIYKALSNVEEMDKLEKITDKDIRGMQVNRKSIWATIEKWCGIELTWNEKVAVGFYLLCFTNQWKKKLSSDIYTSVIHWFMVDYFGLDEVELGRREFFALRQGVKPEYVHGSVYDSQLVITKVYGLQLLCREEFKQYCRNHVAEWRDGRELI